MANYRFIGPNSFSPEQQHIFFGRENAAERLFQNLLIENTALICGSSGSGKSSLLMAGLYPLLEKSGRFEIISLSLSSSPSIPSLHEQFDTIIRSKYDTFTYIDKIIGPQQHLWYHLKKIQALSNKIIVLLIDNFDLFPTHERQKFHSELAFALKGKIPKEFAGKVMKKSSELSEKGKELLNTPTDIKMIWTTLPQSEERLNSFADQYQFNPKNNLHLRTFSPEKAKEILKKTASFRSEYKTLNNFATAPFEISDELLTKIFAQKQADFIPPIEIQLIGQQIEKTVAAAEKTTADDSLRITQISALHQFFSQYVRPKLNNDLSEFLIYISRAPESAEIPSSMIPEGFFEHFSGFIQAIHSPHDNSFNFIFKSELLKEELLEWLQNISSQSNETKPSTNTPKKPKDNNCLKKIIRYYQAASIFLVLLAALGFYTINKARKTAQDNKQLALSNMYAAYSYKNTDNDPTLSFRYAQKAYEHYPANKEAYSALLNAYYNTEVFYSHSGQLPQNMREAVISPDGQYILTIAESPEDSEIKAALFTADGSRIKTFTNETPVYFTGFSANSKEAVFADSKGMLFIYNIQQDRLQRIQAAHTRILHAEIAQNGRILLLSEEGLQLLDASGQLLTQFPEYKFTYDMACLSKDGNHTAAGSGNQVFLFNARGDLIENFNLPVAVGIKYPRITAMQISEQNDKVLTAVNDMLTKTGQLIVTDNKGNALMKYGGHEDWIRTAEFSADGNRLLTASYDKTAAVLDMKGKLIGRLKGHKSLVSDAVFYGNNETVLSVSDDGKILVWKFGRLLNPLAEIQNIDQALFSPSGLKILTAADTLLQIRNIFGEPEVQFDTEGQPVVLANFGTKEQYVYALTKDDRLHFWKPDGSPAHVLEGVSGRAAFVDFYSDSARVLYPQTDSLLIIRDMKSGKHIQKISADARINYACFAQSDGHILTAESSGEMILRAADGKPIRNYKGHTASVKKARFSPDESLIISISNDKTAKLWDYNGRLLHNFPSYNSDLNYAAFSPDGEFIILAYDDNKIRLYTTDGQFTGMISYPGKVLQAVFSSDGDYIITLYSAYGKNTAKLQHISPEIILRYVNEDKVFGNIQEFDLE